MTDQSHSTAETNLVAIDIAKEWNVVLVQEASGQKRNFKVANNAADHDQLLLYLSSLSEPMPAAAQVPVAKKVMIRW